MTPSTRRRTSAAAVLLAAAALVPPAQAAAASPVPDLLPATDGRAAPAVSPPGPARHSSHDLVPVDRVPGTGTLDRRDGAEAREHAGGRPVQVVAASEPIDLPELAVVGVTWSATATSGESVQYRTRDRARWTDWEFLEQEGDGPGEAEARSAARRSGGAREGSAPLVTTDSDEIQVRMVAPEGSASAADAELMVVDPDAGASTAAGSQGTTTADSASSPDPSAAATNTLVSKPRIYTRAEWGADESIREQTEPDYGVVDGAVVHHSAGTNAYYGSQVPEIIQGIYVYHVQGRGWRDIGYNFLVDRYGRIWEGRYGGMSQAVVGAHAAGVNSRMFGVSVLGNYDTATPAAEVTTALRNLIAWKADVHRFDALGTVTVEGTTYHRISGHRNVNSTDCPGDNLYATLPALRSATAALSPSATRHAGADRYETAARASAATFDAGVPVAYVATGANFPDALAAGPAGGHLGGPILLTAKDTLPTPTRTELQRLKPARIVVLGGTVAVSSAVATQLKELAPQVSRVAGLNRYATAAAVSAAVFTVGAPVAYVATGANFPDALAGGPAGGHRGGPLLLTMTGSLPEATTKELARLKPSSIVVLGGSTPVSDAVVSQLRSYSPSVSRVAGETRFDTAARTSARTFAPGAPIAYVATGANFPDALAGGPIGGHLEGPVLLTTRDSLPKETIRELGRLAPARIVVLGGPQAVSTAVAKRLYNYEEP